MSLFIILYNQLRLNARAAVFGLVASFLAVAVYSAFYVLTPIDPCLMSLPAGLLIGHGVSLGALGKRHRFLGGLAVALFTCSYLLGTLPVDLWRHSEQPFWTTIESIYKRFAFIFGQGEEAESFAHFVEVFSSWISLVAGAALARKKNE
ncbi:MAG: hypothetical protein NTW74_26545 [Acidobacteria bacterium]|nr:hypothetical protein [Acidobacteriota bacterium]